MAEESINVPITPNLVILDGVRSRSSEGKLIATKGRATKETDPRRASTGSFRSGGNKFSSGKPSPLNNGASTGSCHDFCKYGKKHETEVKPWHAKARKVIKPMLNQQTNSESGDISENKITKVVKPKPHPVSKTKSPNFTAVSGKTISSPSNESTIPSRPVSAKGKIMIANEKKKDLEKRNTPLLSGKRESETKPDQTNETSKEATRNLVLFPVVHRAIKPSCNGASSLKVNAKRGKKPVSLKDQNKVVKSELKPPSDNTVEEKTLHVITVDGKSTVPESRDKNQEGTKEVKNELIENKNLTGEALPVLEVDSKKLVPELEHNECISDPPSFGSFSSPSISSPVFYNGEEEAQDEVEYINSEKKVPELKQNRKAFDSPPSDSSLSLNIPSPDKTPALSYGEVESQDELEHTNSEKKITELKQNEGTIDSPSFDSFSSHNIPYPFESSALSYGEEEVHNEVEYTSSRKKVPELNKKESTIDSPTSESLLSSNIPFTVPNFLNGEEESKDKLEDTNSEEKDPESKQNDSHIASIPSTVKSPALLCGEEEVDDEVVYLDNEIDGSDDSISESSEILISDEEKTSVQNHNDKTRKAKIVSEEDDPTRKLKFRRGKVVEVECNDTGPKRLKFRRAKLLRESQDNASKSHRKSYEKRGIDDVMDGTEDDSEKIVLRHQQVEGKKDAQGLFNNVIEETATKLAETRKSKVKALVGAFETVISLQESKPSTQTAS